MNSNQKIRTSVMSIVGGLIWLFAGLSILKSPNWDITPWVVIGGMIIILSVLFIQTSK
ncbi:hypothetical protein [Thermococcus sp. MV5]|uniref:hypothetical protein n=1 Tax=Thermococcus sp. MV5 TaxID=1638272 RepID=UPI00143B823C|nr:hypothetical protein [Thermococcus sp. MV5]